MSIPYFKPELPPKFTTFEEWLKQHPEPEYIDEMWTFAQRIVEMCPELVLAREEIEKHVYLSSPEKLALANERWADILSNFLDALVPDKHRRGALKSIIAHHFGVDEPYYQIETLCKLN